MHKKEHISLMARNCHAKCNHTEEQSQKIAPFLQSKFCYMIPSEDRLFGVTKTEGQVASYAAHWGTPQNLWGWVLNHR